MQKKKALSAGCCFLIAFFSCAFSRAQDSVGYINVPKLVNESVMGKAAADEMVKKHRKQRETIEMKQKEAEAIKTVLEKKGDSMEQNERRAKTEELKAAEQAYKDLVNKLDEELGAEQVEIVRAILMKADTVMRNVAQARGYSIILTNLFSSPLNIAYVDLRVDITDDVIKELDRMK